MSATAPDLSISIEATSYLKICFSNKKGETLTVDTDLTPYQLPGFRQRFYEALENVKNFWVQTPLNTGNEYTFYGLCKLMEVTKMFAFELFDIRYTDVNDFFIKSIADWRVIEHESEKIPLIEVKAFDIYMLPLELLPLFGIDDPIPEKSGISDLQAIAAQFPGFSTIVKKVFNNHPQPVSILLADTIENNEKLRIRFFRYEDNSVNEEENFFRKLNRTELRGPWPYENLIQDEFEARLSELIFYANENRQEEIDHIQHFYCHCNTDPVNPDDYSLLLGHKENHFIIPVLTKREIKLGTLKSRFLGLRRPKGSYPLVFLNACGSARIKLQGPNSFPQLLLKLQNRGVIGTEASIPEAFAAKFSQRFYELWFQGITLGQAIYHTKWDMIKRYNNYLGFLYSIYANTDLRVALPIAFD